MARPPKPVKDPYTPFYRIPTLHKIAKDALDILGIELDYDLICPSSKDTTEKLGLVGFLTDINEIEPTLKLHKSIEDKVLGDIEGHYIVSVAGDQISMTLEDLLALPCRIKPVGCIRSGLFYSNSNKERLSESELLFIFDSHAEATKFRLQRG